MLTIQQVEKALPPNLKSAASQGLVDTLNGISNDPLMAETLRNNFISYTSILKEGKFKIEDYLHAVAYVSYKLMGDSNQDAYFKTFPNRYQELLERGADSKKISAYVHAYNKGKLVNLIMEQTLVPVHVLNQDMNQRAINHMAWLMMNAKSEKVQSEAANNLFNATKKPETKKHELAIEMKDTSGLNEMKATLAEMADMQRRQIQEGIATPKQVAASKIIDIEVEENGTD